MNKRGAQDRLLVVFPASTQGKVEAFLRAFRDGLGASLRSFQKGFRDLFGLVRVDFVMCPVSIAVADKAGAEAAYRRAIEAAYRRAIEARLSSGEEVQGCIVVLFDEHAFLKGLQNPYIRTKALLLTLGIPTQEVRMWTVSRPPGQLQYALQNFSVSVYAKLNGTPWTVNQDKTISDELVVGIGFAELSGSRFEDRQRFVGITTVFSGDGTYLLGNVSKECSYADMRPGLHVGYPTKSRPEGIHTYFISERSFSRILMPSYLVRGICSRRNKILDQIAMNVWKIFFEIIKVATKVLFLVGQSLTRSLFLVGCMLFNCLPDQKALLLGKQKPANTARGFQKDDTGFVRIPDDFKYFER